MNLTRIDNPTTDEREYRFRVIGWELGSMQLSPMDRLVIAECNGPDATIADGLLALELMARRIHEAATRKPRGCAGAS